METLLMGYAAVDSGQLLICDPCYIDSEWQKEDFEDIRIYQHKTTGDKLQYRVDFENYESVIPKYGKTMNELTATGEWVFIEEHKPRTGFSYNACAMHTLSEDGFGELKFKMGHTGAGVAFSTVIGDGMYPVYGHFTSDGYLKSVEIKIFDEVEEESELFEEDED